MIMIEHHYSSVTAYTALQSQGYGYLTNK